MTAIMNNRIKCTMYMNTTILVIYNKSLLELQQKKSIDSY